MTKKKQQTIPDTLEARVHSLEAALVVNESQEKELAEQIVTALADGENPEKLQSKRRQVRDSLEDIRQTLPVLKERIKTNRAALSQVKAADRLLGIRRAYGSLLQQYEYDEVRVLDAAKQYNARVAELNTRFKNLAVLVAETSALGSRFGVPVSKLASPVVPALRKGCGQAVKLVFEVKYVETGHIKEDIEADEHGLRKRRTFQEIRGTEGYKLIEAAGLPDFAPLSQKQQQIVAARAKQTREERAVSARYADEIHQQERTPERIF